MSTQLSITTMYPPQQYNLLGNTDVMVQVPEIKSPVIQVVTLDPSDVYVQQKAKREYTDRNGKFHPATPDLYAITKNGLKKLADGAGIKMLSSEHVIPTTCQKCVAANQHSGQVVQCGNCSNQDVAYKVTIAVPQLTGEILTVEDTHEIRVSTATVGMTDSQKTEFLRHLPQICEAKALNGAIRTALRIRGTYTLEELQKPFVVAYLVPNLNQKDVKKAAIENMFQSTARLFGGRQPDLHQIESSVPDVAMIEASDGENYDQYVDDTYQTEPVQEQLPPPQQMQPAQQTPYQQPYQQPPVPQGYYPQQPAQQPMKYRCSQCGMEISDKVAKYSADKFGRSLCMNCQKNNGGR